MHIFPRTLKQNGLDSFTIKVIAIIGMTFSHAANVFKASLPLEILFVFYILGGITYPIIAYLIVEGYIHTSNLKKYMLRLGIFAAISQIPFSLAIGYKANVFVTLLLGLMLLWLWDKLKSLGSFHQILFFPILAAVMYITQYCDWRYVGVLIIWLFYVLKNKKTLGILIPVLVICIWTTGNGVYDFYNALPKAIDNAQMIISRGIEYKYNIYNIGGVDIQLTNALYISLVKIFYGLLGHSFAAVCLLLYNGKRGKPMKYFFYAYYPIHLVMLLLLKFLLFR